MKKILAMLLALILVISMLPVAAFAAEETCPYSSDGHNYSSQTGKCTNSSNRRTCNAECPHEEYDSSYKCTTCKMTCKHSKYSNGQCTQCGAYCQHGNTSDGRKCNTCNTTLCKSNSHNYVNGVCSKCHKVCTHNFNNGVCSKCHYQCPHDEYDDQNKCEVCGKSKPACTNHNYVNGVCTNPGCGVTCKHPKTKLIPAVAATCSTAGHTAGEQCETCNVVKEEPQTIPATNQHQYTEFVGYKEGQEPTCTTPGVKINKCATCTDTAEINVTAAHKEKVLVKVDASCAGEGYTVYTCELCGHDRHETFEKLPHTEEILPVQAATCTENGLKAGKKCSVCQEILVQQEVVNKLGHDWKTVAAKAATCTANGNNQYQECNRCHATLNKEIIPAAHDFSQNPNKCSVCQARNPECEHEGASIVIKAATCTVDGSKTFNCPDCGYKFVETLEKLDHNYVDGTCTACGVDSCRHSSTHVDKKAATCTEEGYENTICNSCSKVVRTSVKSKISHSYHNDFCTMCGCANPNSNKITDDLQDIFTLG